MLPVRENLVLDHIIAQLVHHQLDALGSDSSHHGRVILAQLLENLLKLLLLTVRKVFEAACQKRARRNSGGEIVQPRQLLDHRNKVIRVKGCSIDAHSRRSNRPFFTHPAARLVTKRQS